MPSISEPPPIGGRASPGDSVTEARRLIASGDPERAVRLLHRQITAYPLDHDSFAALGEAWQAVGEISKSVVAFERALQLRELNASAELSAGASRLLDLENAALATTDPLHVAGHLFPRLRVLRKGEGVVLVGRSRDGDAFIKIEVHSNPLKSRDLTEEVEIVRQLSNGGCLTSPRLLDSGRLNGGDLAERLYPGDRSSIGATQDDFYPYYIQEYLRSDRGYNLADIALAMIEQKALGVFHGDIRPENIRFDAEKGLCRFIDFDQAEWLDEATRRLPNREFVEWCAERAREKYRRWNHQHFLTYFRGVDLERDFLALFKGDALDLVRTNIFKQQITTATRAVYHTIDTPEVFIQGERDLDHRRGFLDAIEFADGEEVLDVGCSSGILATYLARRGCRVTGVEIDAKLLNGARILANVWKLPIRYLALDLDNAPLPGNFDTICLFSVIHHTRRLAANGRKIAEACRRRILIECRLQESGLKWTGKGFEKSSAWDYPDLEAMTVGLEQLFPGFRFHHNHGQGDRDRYLLEFHKQI